MTSRPMAPPVIQPSSGNAIVINPCQRLNPLLEAIRNVPKEFGDIVPDFEVGRTTGVLYLSLKYHRLHPEYIHQRIEKLGHRYNLRILLVVCDISEHQSPIRELTKTCLINNITVIVSWTIDEAALYLSTFKQYEHKPPDLIKERVQKDYVSVLRSALTSIKGVNKTDVETLRSNCGSFAGISRASEQRLLDLPGFAQTKVRRLQDAFHKPFRAGSDNGGGGSSSGIEHPLFAATKEQTGLAAISSSCLLSSEQISQGSQGGESSSALSHPHADPPQSSSSLSAQRQPRPPRPPSPVWDIELDLNGSPSPSSEDSDDPPARKKHKVDNLFGKPDPVLTST